MISDSTHGDATFSSAMAAAGNYRRWQVDIFRPWLGESVLEVGIGDGGFRDLLGAREYVGLDLDAELIERARASRTGGDYVQADIEDPALPEALGGRRFDSVLCVNVLEHVPDDAAAVRNLAALLRPGGHLLLFVPAHPALYTEMDRLAGHHRRYRLAAVRALLPEGVDPVRLYYLNPVGALGWWANKLARPSSLEDRQVRGQVMLFDRVALPVSRLLTPLTRRLFGQSVVCVARKS